MNVKLLITKLNQIRLNIIQTEKHLNISALLSGELKKFKYMISEDLGYKPGIVEKAKFEHFSLGIIFNKGLVESNKKDVLLKKLKNIEAKNKEQ